MNIKKVNAGVWVKASELKEIDWPLCIRYDGGGAGYYTTVCSMEELQKHITKYNSIDKIEWLKPVEGYVLSLDEISALLYEGVKIHKLYHAEHGAGMDISLAIQQFLQSINQQ